MHTAWGRQARPGLEPEAAGADPLVTGSGRGSPEGDLAAGVEGESGDATMCPGSVGVTIKSEAARTTTRAAAPATPAARRRCRRRARSARWPTSVLKWSMDADGEGASTLGIGDLLQILVPELSPEGGQSARGVLLDRPGRAAQGGGDLAFAHVEVVAQGDHLPLSLGQLDEGLSQGEVVLRPVAGPTGASAVVVAPPSLGPSPEVDGPVHGDRDHPPVGDGIELVPLTKGTRHGVHGHIFGILSAPQDLETRPVGAQEQALEGLVEPLRLGRLRLGCVRGFGRLRDHASSPYIRTACPPR